VIAAGILRFGDDGKIVEMRSIEPPEFVAMVAANEAT
jgi:roadblock/LC7 domain-containing protein